GFLIDTISYTISCRIATWKQYVDIILLDTNCHFLLLFL
uniref:Uncharacterized protein n=1 Tax=Aegilops tauschii subsp. strangulata TaxID=200361 RepID=A0A453L6P2_AEGTS